MAIRWLYPPGGPWLIIWFMAPWSIPGWLQGGPPCCWLTGWFEPRKSFMFIVFGGSWFKSPLIPLIPGPICPMWPFGVEGVRGASGRFWKGVVWGVHGEHGGRDMFPAFPCWLFCWAAIAASSSDPGPLGVAGPCPGVTGFGVIGLARGVPTPPPWWPPDGVIGPKLSWDWEGVAGAWLMGVIAGESGPWPPLGVVGANSGTDGACEGGPPCG